jgi:hypothetical protein
MKRQTAEKEEAQRVNLNGFLFHKKTMLTSNVLTDIRVITESLQLIERQLLYRNLQFPLN